MTISPVGGANALQAFQPAKPESAEKAGAPDHDGDSDDAGAAKAAAAPQPSPAAGRTVDVQA